MPEAAKEFDLAIIGGGPGGYVAAIKAGQLGLKTCLIEKERVGGTCLHRGCIPTKSLLYSAYLYHLCKRSHEFGVKISGVEIDIPQFHRRKEAVVGRLYRGVKLLLKKNRVEVIEAEGRLTGHGNISLIKEGKETGEVKAKKIIIATGSVPAIPSWIPFDRKVIMSSDEILGMEEAPSSLVIAGGGDIGVEFGYFYNTIGTDVTIVEMKENILPSEDGEIGSTLKRLLARRGMKIFTSTTVEHVTMHDSGVKVEIKKKDGQKETIGADKMLVALGRRPVIDGIGLEEPGIEIHKGFIRVNERFETSVSDIFAIGDVIGPPLLAHSASQQGIIAVLQMAGKEAPPFNPLTTPRVNYSYPQVASIGLTEAEAKEKGYEVKVAKFPFTANSKAVISGDDEGGFVKVVADKKYGEILGVHMIGPDVSELIGGLSLALSLEATALDISNAIFPHPTLSEVLKEAAHVVGGEAIHLPPSPPRRGEGRGEFSR